MLSERNLENEVLGRKLFRRSAFHVLALLHHAHVAIQSSKLDFSEHPDPELKDLMVYAPRFLTTWNFVFQTIFLVVALTCDLVELYQTWRDKPSSTPLHFFRDTLFSALVFPYTLFVASMFWTLYIIDRELVYPKAYDIVLSWSYNLSLHLWVLVVVAVEMFLSPRRKMEEHRLNLGLLWAVQILYAVVYYGTYFSTGRWLYHVFKRMSWPYIAAFQILVWISIHLYYHLQWPIFHCINGGRIELSLSINNAEKCRDVSKREEVCKEWVERNGLPEEGNGRPSGEQVNGIVVRFH